MTGLFPSGFVGIHALEITLLFFVAGTFVLLRSLMTQDEFIQAQKLSVADLELKLESSLAQQTQLAEQLDVLQEQCTHLHARQQLVEKHGSDTQRIDLAMRMLKRGNGSAETLKDLGLSASEIKLLLTLHSAPPSVEDHGETGKERAEVPGEARVRVVQDSASPSVTNDIQSAQGARLARLFKQAAG